ncbi:MAG: FimB/Mfa2 family fimbrial subunit [Tannerellaceae bacterium]|jgi:hypothetical protein|nr:FimB/Mfa2 family fimbrial subunit [Tannerellaceae bacterium]
MKPLNLLKTVGVPFWPVLLLLLMSACVKDDLSECGVTIRYQYTRNIEGVDKFISEIKKINLFVFDSNGLFLTEYTANEKELNNGQAMHLNIPPGTYDLVCWGNLGDDYQLPAFERGKTSVKEVMLSLKRTKNTVVNPPQSLFFGSLSQIQILPDIRRKQILTIDMIKDTKKIRIITKQLPPQEIAGNQFDCRIISVNGDYKFDNSIAGNESLWYVPQTSVNEEKQLLFDFVTMRELKDGSTRSKLIFTYRPIGKEEEELFSADLTEILLSVSKTKDLDIEDYFEIEMSLDYTNGSTTIQIKGWETIDTGYVIG